MKVICNYLLFIGLFNIVGFCCFKLTNKGEEIKRLKKLTKKDIKNLENFDNSHRVEVTVDIKNRWISISKQITEYANSSDTRLKIRLIRRIRQEIYDLFVYIRINILNIPDEFSEAFYNVLHLIDREDENKYKSFKIAIKNKLGKDFQKQLDQIINGSNENAKFLYCDISKERRDVYQVIFLK